jgi:hypothetical protein
LALLFLSRPFVSRATVEVNRESWSDSADSAGGCARDFSRWSPLLVFGGIRRAPWSRCSVSLLICRCCVQKQRRGGHVVVSGARVLPLSCECFAHVKRQLLCACACHARQLYFTCVEQEHLQMHRPPGVRMLMHSRAQTKTRGNPGRGTRVPGTKSCCLPRWQCVCNAVGAAAQVGMRVLSATARCKDKMTSDISCYCARIQQQHNTS